MAKGNLFLGMGRGKVGDLVFYRQYGEQVTRARNRSPRNPNSYKQRVQRAIMASVSRIYSLGYRIFDHSWQGERVGQGSQSAFVKANVAILRNLVTAELKAGTPVAECKSRVGAPGLSVAVPFEGLQISSGSYPQQLFIRRTDTSDLPVSTFVLPAAAAGGETVAAYAARNGMVADDIYTILALGVSASPNNVVFDLGKTTDADYARIFTSKMVVVQLRVKQGLENVTDSIGEETSLATFFDVISDDGVDYTQVGYQVELTVSTFVEGYPNGVMGIIRSRDDSPLRSESFAYFTGDLSYGLTPNYINEAWQKELVQAGSDLILEGADFTPGEA